MQYKTMMKTSVIILSALFLFQPKISYAAWRDHGHFDHHYYGYHDHPHFGLHVSFIPDAAFSISLGGGRNYSYYDGLYYSRFHDDYVIVAPPIGATVAVIPTVYTPVIINGTTYYTDNGVYYVYTPYGYQVVPQPVAMVQSAPVVINQISSQAAPTSAQIESTNSTTPTTQVMATPATADTPDSFIINIPNDKGGYTAVTIKRSGKGFVGPQGEFYDDFPKVSQLKVMYAK